MVGNPEKLFVVFNLILAGASLWLACGLIFSEYGKKCVSWVVLDIS
jgi:hypothetical protein|tara:strand:+ start:123 stop:260 length:138 start_codon:yes stop_codon:yes gene_type:complete